MLISTCISTSRQYDRYTNMH